MKTKLLGIIIFLTVTNLFAIYEPSWERPVWQAREMSVENSYGDFENIKYANLVLTRKDGAADFTGMILYLYDSQDSIRASRVVNLQIIDIEELNCGSRKYYAELKPEINTKSKVSLNFGGRNFVEHRFSLELVDHTSRSCRDSAYFDLYSAFVREGYGWAGSLDHTMEIFGNPEVVFTVQ